MKSIVSTAQVMVFMTILSACNENEAVISPTASTSINFDITELTVREDGTDQYIQLSLDKPAAKDGWVNIVIHNIDVTRIRVEPVPLNSHINFSFAKGQQVVKVRVTPINNLTADGNATFDMAIIGMSPGFSAGTRKTLNANLVDDELLAPAGKATANFISTIEKTAENTSEGRVLSIQLSRNLNEAGTIELELASSKGLYGIHFTTIPAPSNGKITISPALDQAVATVTLLPIDNSVISGEYEVSFTITSTTGSIVKGIFLNQSVVVTDDELINKPKGYIIDAGFWSMKRQIEYNEDSKVKSILTEESTPATSSRTETYVYDAFGHILRINSYPEIGVVYTWSDNRIVKSETIDHGRVKRYNEYDYDSHGNVSGVAAYYLQPDGQYKLEYVFVYLYFQDGNLYKSLTYIPNGVPGDYSLISTRTYEGYLESENPFPMVEILPNMRTQKNLPSTYTIEENGKTLVYTLSYEFRPDGRVSKRISRNGSSTESAQYLYY